MLDCNEFPPVLVRREYRGRVSEAAPAGALVLSAAEPGEPLVLDTADGDSPAHHERAFELPPAAARLFRVHPTTGALLLARALDYEQAARHEFTVKVRAAPPRPARPRPAPPALTAPRALQVVDAGTPRLPSESTATVVVEVEDANDCAPEFPRAAYEAVVALPTAAGVLVATLAARDRDLPPGEALKYDIVEGDEEGAFAVAAGGAVTVARPERLRARAELRVRASDGRWAATARLAVRARAPEPAGLAFAQPEYFGAAPENSSRPATLAVLAVLGAALDEHVAFSILNPVEGFEVSPRRTGRHRDVSLLGITHHNPTP